MSSTLSSLAPLVRSYSAGELNSDELERIVTILQNPTQFKIPTWFLNRQKDITDGKNSQILSNAVDSKLRDDLERLKRMRNHRGIRHYWGVKVRGQHTKTTGRRGKTGGFYSRHELGRWLIVFRRRYSRCAQEEVIYAYIIVSLVCLRIRVSRLFRL